MDSCLSQSYCNDGKSKQSHPEFELWLLFPFPSMITITLSAPPMYYHTLTIWSLYIHLSICSLVLTLVGSSLDNEAPGFCPFSPSVNLAQVNKCDKYLMKAGWYNYWNIVIIMMKTGTQVRVHKYFIPAYKNRFLMFFFKF